MDGNIQALIFISTNKQEMKTYTIKSEYTSGTNHKTVYEMEGKRRGFYIGTVFATSPEIITVKSLGGKEYRAEFKIETASPFEESTLTTF